MKLVLLFAALILASSALRLKQGNFEGPVTVNIEGNSYFDWNFGEKEPEVPKMTDNSANGHMTVDIESLDSINPTEDQIDCACSSQNNVMAFVSCLPDIQPISHNEGEAGSSDQITLIDFISEFDMEYCSEEEESSGSGSSTDSGSSSSSGSSTTDSGSQTETSNSQDQSEQEAEEEDDSASV